MKMKRYWIENTSSEPILRKYFLGNADMVRMTSAQHTELRWFWPKKQGGEADPWFRNVTKRLHHDFQRREAKYYYYRFSPTMKALLNHQTLFWGCFPPLPGAPFYCFEDPVFYRKKKEVGGVITHERYIFLNLTPAEKKKWEDRGVSLVEEG